ncbi:MAG: tryptophan-rich sensory protein [Roseburia sp.]|nr:tryptophan-rich sensory protein [Roseburia sp.]
MNTKSKSSLTIAVLIPIAVGTLSALFSGNMMLYERINKPALAPPGFLFPLVWILLYILMGISSYIVSVSDSPSRHGALKRYALQLFFNFFWSILFFRFNWYFIAFLWLLAMLVLIAAMINAFRKIKPLAAYLQIPYLLWCLFAAYLNFMIYRMN